MMKKYITNIIILFFLISCTTNKGGFIEFEHIGEQDKPIESLRIVKKEMPPDILTKVVKVDEKSFNYLFKYLTKGRKEGILLDRRSYSHGSFKVTIARDTTVNFCYTIEGRKQSFVFFQGIVEYLKQNNLDENLQKAINTVIIQRINKPNLGFPEQDSVSLTRRRLSNEAGPAIVSDFAGLNTGL